MRRVTTRGARVAVVATTVLSACAGSHQPQLVSLPQPSLRPVSRLEHIFDYRTAAATVVSISERDLGFPPFPITFRLYPHQGAFEKALLDSGYDAALARSTARTMIAVGGHRGVLLNELRLSNLEWPDRVALLAHEMTHSLQYELGGGVRGTSDQWLREGFADWMALQVLDRIADISIAGIRRARQNEVRSAGRPNVPRLSELVTFREWVKAGERHKSAIYALAFVAVELLLERHGVPAFIDYFKRFATSRDRVANFRAAFGEDLESFERAVIARVWTR
jgi:hypothetical protein